MKILNIVDVVTVIKTGQYDEWEIPEKDIIDGNVPCKIFYSLKQEELESVTGEKVIVTAKFYMEGLYNIKLGDRLKFTDDFGQEYTKEVVDVKAIKDFSENIIYTRAVV